MPDEGKIFSGSSFGFENLMTSRAQTLLPFYEMCVVYAGHINFLFWDSAMSMSQVISDNVLHCWFYREWWRSG